MSAARLRKRIAGALLAVMLIPCSAYAAANGSADPVQAKSSDTATIYLGKILTAAQADKFPAVTDFLFNIESVKAWDNANPSASQSGSVITPANMPRATAVTAAHQKVTVKDTTNVTVEVGNFSGNKNTNVADTVTEKFRVTPVSIKFTKAGYYMYRVTETASVPAEIPGMAYDDNSYYIVVYVCNKTDDKGNTTSGVYVHDITSYRNSPETDYQANLTDIQNTPDNGGVRAKENNYDNMTKVGITTPDPGTDPKTGLAIGPNKLEAFKFYNDQTTHDVVLTNNVTGNLGDITKEFEYTVTLTGLEKNRQYTTNVAAQDKPAGTGILSNTTSAGADIAALPSGGKGTVDVTAKTFTSDSGGSATFMVRLADDEVMVLNSLPATAKYTVSQAATDHIASFTSESTEDDTWVMVKKSDANTVSSKAIATAAETVDSVSNVPGRSQHEAEDNDGTVTVNFRNHRDLMTPTGLPYYGDFAYVLTAITAAAAVLLVIRRKRSRS